METLKIGNIARDVERENLPLAGFGQLVAVSEAFQNEAALSRSVALPHKVLIGTDRLNNPADGAEHVLLVLGEDKDALQLVDEWDCVGGRSHDGLPSASCRGSTHLSQPVAPVVRAATDTP